MTRLRPIMHPAPCTSIRAGWSMHPFAARHEIFHAHLGGIVALLLFGLLQGINQGIKAGLGDKSNNRLWTTSRMSAVSSMPAALMDRMQTVQGVRTIAHLSFFGGYFQDAKNPIPAFATNVDKLAVVYPELGITS